MCETCVIFCVDYVSSCKILVIHDEPVYIISIKFMNAHTCLMINSLVKYEIGT